MKKWLKDIWNDKFKRFLILALVILGIVLLFTGASAPTYTPANGLELHFFFHPTCPHCKAQKVFNEQLKLDFPEVKFIYHDVSDPEEAVLLRRFAEKSGIPSSNLGVPATFFGDYEFVGFNTPETTGKDIRSALQDFVAGKSSQAEFSASKRISLPILGDIDVMEYSIPALAVILGLIDGFNPCAMWVLVYLISLILSVKDRRKVWILVGSFVAASGILYFLFMAAWLNAFLLIGYLRPITIAIGMAAIGLGTLSVREFIRTKGALVCDVGDMKSKKRTISKMERIVFSPLTITTLLGIIALAFVVNSVEFACSSAIPAVFTQVLALSHLSSFSYYMYILLYDFFFMLDDLIIFGLAAFAINTTIGNRYAKYCKLIGGVLLLLMGLVLAFAPQLLR